MKLSIDKLLAGGVRLELSNDDATKNVLDIGRGEDVRGAYASDADTIRVEEVSAAALEVASAQWHVGAAARVSVAPLALEAFTVDLEIARGALRGRQRLLGRVGARALRGGALAYHAVARDLDSAAISAEGFAISFGEDGALEVRAAELALTDARLRVGSLEIVAGAVIARGVQLRYGGAGGLEVAVAALELRDVKIDAGETSIALVNVRASSGVRLSRGVIEVEALEVDETALRATIAAPSGAAAAAPTSVSSAPRAPLDLALLDGLSGHVNADLNFDARIPVIKRRTATHRFRVPIDRGTIDFHELERDLSFLEDAVLDFKLKGDRLVFQKDIPLIPFDEETIVYWSLDAEEVTLAEGNRVRLRRLARVERPEPKKKPKSDEPSGLEILKLDIDPIEAVLHLAGDARLDLGSMSVRLGQGTHPAIGELRVSGAVRHRPGQPPQPGELKLSVSKLAIAIERLLVGGMRASVEVLAIASISDAHVSFEGVRPTDLQGTLRGFEARGLRLEPVI